MNKLFENIGFAITSMAAVIFVLVLTLMGLITFTHTVFNEVLPHTITGWERSFASWMLALGWEFTLLITTCNTQFLHRRIPLVVAIASGFIVLFFIQAFDVDQPIIELFKKCFIGLLVATINYIYTELFYSKWKELQLSNNLSLKITTQEIQIENQERELTNTRGLLTKANSDVERLVEYVTELEEFRSGELKKLTCPYCNKVQETIYKLTSHKSACKQNAKKSQKQSIYDVA